MKSKKFRKLISSAAAGKLSLSAAVAHAQQSCPDPISFKLDDSDVFLVATTEILTLGGSQNTDTGSKLTRKSRALGKADDSTTATQTAEGVREQTTDGTIYTRALSKSSLMRIEVQGISREQDALTVYVYYAKSLGHSDKWISIDCGDNQMEVDPETLEVMAAVTIPKKNADAEFPQTALGDTEPSKTIGLTSSVLGFDLEIADLQDSFESGDQVFLQALAIPIGEDGEFIWNKATVSAPVTLNFNFSDTPPENSGSADTGGGGFGSGKVITS